MSKELVLSVTKDDFNISYFSGTGAGGQHRNKHMVSVRIMHRDSGAMATAQDSRSKELNLKEAFQRVIATDKFKAWHKIAVANAMMTSEEKRQEKEQIENEVNESMNENNLKIEVKNSSGEWIREQHVCA